MVITWRSRKYQFRDCDIKGHAQSEVEQMAKDTGYIQLDPRASWLFVPGIGYGWEVS